MNKQEQIIEILEDKSFPRVMLIDGAWGTGKTYFIREQLKDSLEKHFKLPVLFFSLYGISSIDDFRDKIISLSMTGTEDSSKIARIASNAIEGLATNMGEKGIGAMLSGAAGAYKYRLYNSLDNCILILDDLERIYDEKVIKCILGESLELAESRNVKVIVVANEDKLTCKPDIEKVFSDKFKFGSSHQDVMKIIKEQYDDLDDDLLKEIYKNIKALDSKNIRVLKRSISKFNRIRKEIQGINNINEDKALSDVLSHIIRICVAKYEHGFSKEQIIHATTKSFIEKEDADENEKQIKVNSLFSNVRNNVSIKLIDYCCDGVYDFGNLALELRLPSQMTLLDKVISDYSRYALTDQELKEGVILLEDYINQGKNVSVYEWFTACDAYIKIIDKKMIEENKFSVESLISLCKNVDDAKFSLPTKEDIRNRRYRNYPMSPELYEIFINKERNVDLRAEKVEISVLIERFYESWDQVEMEFEEKYMHKAIYQEISIDTMKNSVENWSNSEFLEFVYFNKRRFKFSNIYDDLADEVDTLKLLINMLNSMSSKMGFGVKVASIDELVNCFTDAVTRMERHHQNTLISESLD
ncbi:KAP family NTPase [Vibrio chagasii]|uniref:KAP family NTPase n=1 Tax=Vibrio chagasii TaxID=170679 RepID=UPI001EFCD346|nr:KAP family NTPase [Vibrio chagasii]MCG9604534.1 KAP family NTPase [Vibrio chagasii]